MKSLPNYDIDTVSALFAGIVCAGLFNPFDRAMFLASNNKTPIFLRTNFTKPFHGYMQAVLQRAFVYFCILGVITASFILSFLLSSDKSE